MLWGLTLYSLNESANSALAVDGAKSACESFTERVYSLGQKLREAYGMWT
jgi:hypothetical protein